MPTFPPLTTSVDPPTEKALPVMVPLAAVIPCVNVPVAAVSPYVISSPPALVFVMDESRTHAPGPVVVAGSR